MKCRRLSEEKRSNSGLAADAVWQVWLAVAKGAGTVYIYISVSVALGVAGCRGDMAGKMAHQVVTV